VEFLDSHMFLLKNAVIWSILATAALCYSLLIDLCFIRKHNERWHQSTNFWIGSIKQMLAALPLLGLLGTINGLLGTFTRMSVQSGFSTQEIISGGIAEAMFTTQLGLVMVIPGFLLLRLLNTQNDKWIIKKAHEINT
jgi:biopolymer transport protein ExbB